MSKKKIGAEFGYKDVYGRPILVGDRIQNIYSGVICTATPYYHRAISDDGVRYMMADRVWKILRH